MSKTIDANIPAINDMPEQHVMIAVGTKNVQPTPNEPQMTASTDITLSDDLRFRKSDNEKKNDEYAEKFREYLDNEADGERAEDTYCDITEPPDPFDPASLRINPESSGVAGKKVITAIRCDKPNRQDFVRVRPGDEWRLDTMLLEEEGGDTYIVSPRLHDELVHECFPARLVLATTRNNTPFLWRLKLPRSDGQSNHWNDAALVAAKLAETKWVRIASNMTAKCYDVFEATGINVEPQWADDLEFKDILRLCFKDRFIDSLDHPFLQRLRGEV